MCETKALWPVRLLWITLFTLLALGRPTFSQAQQIEQTGVRIDSISQTDQDDDGDPDLTVIECSFATDRDRVLVYDGAGDMAWAEEWQQATDFDDDVWIFDAGADASAQLVIRFSRDGDLIAADLFDDRDGDGAVSYEIRAGQVFVTESAHPPLSAVATGGWFLPGGQLNWNVRFLTDGPSVTHMHTFNLSGSWQSFFALDGEPDAGLQFYDRDLDGVPEYGLWRLLAPLRQDWVSIRTVLWANVGRHHPRQPLDYLFWPYLDPDGAAQNYFDLPTAIRVDWDNASVAQISFPGYPIEHGLHVGTLHRFEPGVLNYANFENAQAYYDLAADQDGSPELHIRHRYYAAGDPHGGSLASPVNEIRWSWSQTSEAALAWDYKLGLAGRHAITSEVSFGEYRYLTVPYEELPDWTVSRPWDYATFVSREDKDVPFVSSEGIYAWGPVEATLDGDGTVLSRYLAGELDLDVRQAFQKVSPGWRGELAPRLGAEPYLYFSPIDRRLHLRHAEYGLWQIDDTHMVHLADQDGDGYLDQWQYRVDDELQTHLGHLAGFLLYAGQGQVRLKPLAVEPASFETLPPVNHSEWLALGQQLEAHARDFAPGDLEAMLVQFPGAEWRVAGASLRDLRPEGDGFRFVLELAPGFRVHGSGGPDLSRLAPGDYVVTYDSRFTVQPLTPARATLVTGSFALSDPAPIAVQPLRVNAVLRNVGLEDFPSLWVQAYARQPGAPPYLLGETEVVLLAGQSLPVSFDWAPPVAGQWQINLAWGPDRQALEPFSTGPELSVVAQPAPHLDANQVLKLSNMGAAPALISLLLALALLATGFVALWLREARQA